MISKQVLQLALAYNGDWNKIALGLKENYCFPSLSTKESYVTIFDKDYPEQLRKLRYPPWVLFYQGDFSLLSKPCMTVIGSREPSSYGVNATIQLVRTIKKEFVVVSGLAKGIDGIAHQEALVGGKTIAVIGSGLNYEYPSSNSALYREIKKNHCIISEYPCYTPIARHQFPWRNRLLAALSDCCIVTSAALKSGTMLTVNECLSLSKEVYVVPHPIGEKDGEGCNQLISEGATILCDYTTFLENHRKKD